MDNRIYHISKKQIKDYWPQQNDRIKVVQIDFKKISNWREYSEMMEQTFDFPRPVNGSPNRFLDWMRDLSWYDYDGYFIFVYHFSSLSSKNFADAYEIYQEFLEYILPFWDNEVIHVIVEGKPKDFNVYFVE